MNEAESNIILQKNYITRKLEINGIRKTEGQAGCEIRG